MTCKAINIERKTHLSKPIGALLAVGMALCISLALTTNAYATTPTSQEFRQTQLGYQVVPVTLQAGAVRLDFEAGASTAWAGLYAKADADGNTSGTIAYTSSNTPYAKESRYGKVAKAGTYYLQFHVSKYSGALGSKATVTQFPYEEVADAGLNASTLGTGCGDNNKVAYYKLDVDKRGCLSVNVFDATGGGSNASVQLCDSAKRSLSGPNFTYVTEERPAYFGVKKGTYYLAVKSYADLYSVEPLFEAVTKAVKTKKNKAVTIKKGKTTTAVIAAGEKTA